MLVLEFVNMVNRVDPKAELPDDESGEVTISYLKKCLKVANLINSNDVSSLGLHPAVYFYAKNGRHKPASFMATIEFVIYLKSRKQLKKFTEVRKEFEDILINSEDLIQQIVRKYRSGAKSVPHVRSFYIEIIEQLTKKSSPKEAIENILNDSRFNYLSIRDTNINEITNTDFSSDRKSEVFIMEALESALRCNICGGYIHRNSISIDHIKRKEDGGIGTVDNGQVSHPYCNSGYKN